MTHSFSEMSFVAYFKSPGKREMSNPRVRTNTGLIQGYIVHHISIFMQDSEMSERYVYIL